MRNRTRLLASTSVLITMIGAIFLAGWQQSSFGQVSTFYLYQLEVHCIPRAAAVIFTVQGSGIMGTTQACAGKCGGGIVTLDEALARFPAEVKDKLKAQVENAPAGEVGCLAGVRDGKKPPEDKKPKCEPPSKGPEPPWFNPDVPCSERTKGTISWKLVRGTRDRSYEIKMCGEVISYILPRGAGPDRDPSGIVQDYSDAPGVRVFDVCCDSWRNAANTKSPCDARLDIDCDGMLNKVDRFAEIALDERRPWNFFAYHGPGWPPSSSFYTEFESPDQSECKDCKWELVRFECTCKNIPDLTSSDSSGEDIFDAKHTCKVTWKCPANGPTKDSEETVTMPNTRCPREEPGFRP